MVSEISVENHPEHLGTFGPEQDYLSRFYCTFIRGDWSHIHARYNYQLMLPDDYCSSAHKALDIAQDVVVAHYSGPRVKPWELQKDVPLDPAGVRRLLTDDSVKEVFAREQGPSKGKSKGRPPPPRERIMDGVLVVEQDVLNCLPADVQKVMFEWVLALRACEKELREAGTDLMEIISS
jgi:hypothetical protein